jgi:hypothetical protein
MPARRMTIDPIRAELAWVNPQPDPNKCGCRNMRCCEETATRLEPALESWQRSSGRFAGSITVSPAASTNGGAPRRLDIWLPGETASSPAHGYSDVLPETLVQHIDNTAA